MAEAADVFDVTAYPALRDLADEVSRSGQPRILRADDRDIAVVAPITDNSNPGTASISPEDRAAFLSAAGTWEDMDVDALIEDIHEQRRRNHPLCERISYR